MTCPSVRPCGRCVLGAAGGQAHLPVADGTRGDFTPVRWKRGALTSTERPRLSCSSSPCGTPCRGRSRSYLHGSGPLPSVGLFNDRADLTAVTASFLGSRGCWSEGPGWRGAPDEPSPSAGEPPLWGHGLGGSHGPPPRRLLTPHNSRPKIEHEAFWKALRRSPASTTCLPQSSERKRGRGPLPGVSPGVSTILPSTHREGGRELTGW